MIRLVLAALVASLAMPVVAAPCAAFADVDDTDPFCPNVTWIKNRNITLGCATGLYCPAAAVSRLSIAAFLNRLGDVLLPPNVIWVAPVGGQFQSVQSAIDYAASLPGDSRRLVKVAPGTYNESIVMAPSVDVEGSGPDATTISSAVCSPGMPTTGTVKGASNSQLRDVTVSMRGAVPSNQCAAVYLDTVNGTALRNVRVEMRIVGGAPSYGIIVVSTIAEGWELTLDQVRVDALDLGAQRTGILIDGGASRSTRLQDVTVSGPSENSPVVGLRVATGNVTLDRTRVILTQGVPPGVPSVALQLAGVATANVERSALRSSASSSSFAEVAAGATLRVANSLLEGLLVGTATCFSNYDPNFAPATC